jgi:hypothetical protein
VHFLKLELRDAGGKLLSDNFYWHALTPHPDDLRDLNKLPVVTLEAEAKRRDAEGKCIVDVVLHNPGKQIALMTHLQLRREKSKDRVLPVFYTDNYISLAPGETRGLTIEAALADLKGENAWIAVDGWNIAVGPSSGSGVSVSLNAAAQVGSYPASGLAIDQVRPGKIEGAVSNAPH